MSMQMYFCARVAELRTFLADTRRNNNVIITSKRRRDVVLT